MLLPVIKKKVKIRRTSKVVVSNHLSRIRSAKEMLELRKMIPHKRAVLTRYRQLNLLKMSLTSRKRPKRRKITLMKRAKLTRRPTITMRKLRD